MNFRIIKSKSKTHDLTGIKRIALPDSVSNPVKVVDWSQLLVQEVEVSVFVDCHYTTASNQTEANTNIADANKSGIMKADTIALFFRTKNAKDMYFRSVSAADTVNVEEYGES